MLQAEAEARAQAERDGLILREQNAAALRGVDEMIFVAEGLSDLYGVLAQSSRYEF